MFSRFALGTSMLLIPVILLAGPAPTVFENSFEKGVIERITLTSAQEYYQQACENPSVQFVIPVEINEDHWSDFIVHYWCDQIGDMRGTEITTPTQDALVAFLSDPGGNYSINNEAVFGTRYPKLGGASRQYVRGDINGDGRDDFAFAMNWEDGRLADNVATNATEPSVLMSAGSSSYDVVRLGTPLWGHAVGLFTNPDQTVDVLFAGFTAPGALAFKYQNGSFVDVTNNYPNDAGQWAIAFSSIDDGANTGYVIGGYNETDTVGLRLHHKTQSDWNPVGVYSYPVYRTIQWISWQGTLATNVKTFLFNDEELVGAAFNKYCIMESLYDGAPPIIVAKLSGTRYEGGTLDPTIIYNENDFAVVNLLQFFEFSPSGLTLIQTPMQQEEIRVNYNFFDCDDVNGDGYSDIVAWVISQPVLGIDRGGKPMVYLNDGTGNLIHKNIDDLPGLEPLAGWGLDGFFWDTDKDNVADMLIKGTTTHINNGNIEIFKLPERLRLP